MVSSKSSPLRATMTALAILIGVAGFLAPTFGLGAAHAQQAPRLIGREAFVDRVVEKLRATGATEIKRKGPLQLEIMFGDQGPVTMYLDNAWQTYLRDPTDPSSVIDTMVAAVTNPAELDAPIDRKAIVPVIRHQAYLANTLPPENDLSPADRAKRTLAHYILNDELVLLFAEDGENKIRYLSQADVRELGIDGDPLFRMALDNLMRRIPGMERVGEKVIMIRSGGVYESSMVLARHIWRPENFPVEGAYVFAIPARDVVLLTGSAQTEDVSAMRDMAREIANESAYSISERLFTFGEDGGIDLYK